MVLACDSGSFSPEGGSRAEDELFKNPEQEEEGGKMSTKRKRGEERFVG